ncbi:MAG: rhodanese-like domain-containing protein [Verrucomicrobiales bacterium]
MKIEAKQLQQEIESDKRVTLIDVRTPVEHREMHIDGSELVPLNGMDAEEVKRLVGNSDRCVIVCQSGKRAEKAYEKLLAAGCENLVILDGGVNSWHASGLPLNRTERKVLPLMRQVQLCVGSMCFLGAVLALTVDVRFAIIPAFFGAGLTMAGATGWCGLAIFLSKMPWNQEQCGGGEVKSCSVS